MVNLNDFEKEYECLYKTEHYAVHDDGGVFRKPYDSKRPRPTDNKWAYGISATE
ncbi:hypothetical protein [Arachidicoccus ginsenosidimutans]|uniref:hypothetical protein n=1 Tax=Arachidicoccus sp. BS20 TaxID=1850526 RepID=UPI0012E850AA|nr:hypothetical protein [Arachidicoccus sp. BS20]